MVLCRDSRLKNVSASFFPDHFVAVYMMISGELYFSRFSGNSAYVLYYINGSKIVYHVSARTMVIQMRP